MRENPEFSIGPVSHPDIGELLTLMRSYCEFYGVEPRDERLVSLSRALLADPGEGLQLLARLPDGEAVGFATVYWSWSTLIADRVGIMYDLYVDPVARRKGIARALIEECRGRCRSRGAKKLTWTTAVDNLTARRLYDSTGADGETWVEYDLDAW